MTSADVAHLMSYMASAFAREVSADTIAVWADSLAGVEAAHARSAARQLATTSDRFPPLAAFLRACRDEERFARLASAAPALAPGESTFPCRCGEMRGWLVVAGGNPPTLRPCPSCRPDADERWNDGHWMPDHSCSACERRRKAA